MRRLATATLSLLLSAAALYSSAAPAAACTCGYLTDVEAVREIMEYYDIVVEGVIPPRDGDLPTDHMRFQPEIVYQGEAPPEVILDQAWGYGQPDPFGYYSQLGADCSYALTGVTGDRYVLFLQVVEDGIYEPGGCSSFALAEIQTSPYDWPRQHYNAITLISDGGTLVGEAPPQDEPAEPNEDTPWAVILPLAFAIPLAVLGIPAFLHRRGGH